MRKKARTEIQKKRLERERKLKEKQKFSGYTKKEPVIKSGDEDFNSNEINQEPESTPLPRFMSDIFNIVINIVILIILFRFIIPFLFNFIGGYQDVKIDLNSIPFESDE